MFGISAAKEEEHVSLSKQIVYRIVNIITVLVIYRKTNLLHVCSWFPKWLMNC